MLSWVSSCSSITQCVVQLIKKKYFPKTLDWKLFLLLHTMQKFSTLAVDWLEDTHGQGWGTGQSTPLPPCGLGSILAQTQYVRVVCWFSTLLQEVIPWALQVPKTNNKNKKLVVQLCSTKYTETFNIIVIRITKFFANYLTSLLFLPHTSQPCLEPKLQFPLRPIILVSFFYHYTQI